MRVKMSLLALFNYDDTIFNDFVIPDGMDGSVLLPLLLMETADLSVVYPDPDLIKNIMGTWSERKLPIWQKLFDSTNFVYNPLYNYDRTETRTLNIAHNGYVENTGTVGNIANDFETDANAGTSGNTVTDTGTVGTAGNSSDISSRTGTVTDAKTGYNSVSFQDTDRQTNDLHDTSGHSDNSTETRNLQTQSNQTLNNTRTRNTVTSNTRTDNTKETRNLNDAHLETIRSFGNIGVMSTQELIERTRELDKFDVYSVIIDDFIDYFCVGIY